MTADRLGTIANRLDEVIGAEMSDRETLAAIVAELRALTPAAAGADWRAGWLACRREVFALCEATGDEVMPKPINDHAAGFERGRRHEAKGIARAMNAIDPPAAPAPPPADAVRALVGKWREMADEPAFPDEDNRDWVVGNDAGLRMCADELERALSAAPAGEECQHEAWEENGGWCRCADCGHGWPAAAPTPEGMTSAFMAEVVQAAIECMDANGMTTRTGRLREVRAQLAQQEGGR